MNQPYAENQTQIDNINIQLQEQYQQIKILQKELNQKQLQINKLKQNENNLISHINVQNTTIQQLQKKIKTMEMVQETQTQQILEFNQKFNVIEAQISQLQPKTETFNSQQYLSNNMGNMSLSQIREQALNTQLNSCEIYPLKYNIWRFKNFIQSCTDARITFLNGPISIDDNLLAISNIKKCFSDASGNEINFIRNSVELNHVSFMSQSMDCVFWVLDLQPSKLEQQELLCLFKGIQTQLRIITVSDVSQNFVCIRQKNGSIIYHNKFDDIVEYIQNGAFDSRMSYENTNYSSKLSLNMQNPKQIQQQQYNGLLEVILCQSNGYDGGVLANLKMSSLLSVGQTNLILSYPQEIISLTLVQSYYKTLDALQNVENLVLIQVPVDIQQLTSLTKLKRLLILECFDGQYDFKNQTQNNKSQGFIDTSVSSFNSLRAFTQYFLQIFQRNPLEYINIYDEVFTGQVIIDFCMTELRFLSINFDKQELQENKLIINQKLAKLNNLEACSVGNVSNIEIINGNLPRELLQ